LFIRFNQNDFCVLKGQNDWSSFCVFFFSPQLP
jgi:hypothetical protein